MALPTCWLGLTARLPSTLAQLPSASSPSVCRSSGMPLPNYRIPHQTTGMPILRHRMPFLKLGMPIQPMGIPLPNSERPSLLSTCPRCLPRWRKLSPSLLAQPPPNPNANAYAGWPKNACPWPKPVARMPGTGWSTRSKSPPGALTICSLTLSPSCASAPARKAAWGSRHSR